MKATSSLIDTTLAWDVPDARPEATMQAAPAGPRDFVRGPHQKNSGKADTFVNSGARRCKMNIIAVVEGWLSGAVENRFPSARWCGHAGR